MKKLLFALVLGLLLVAALVTVALADNGPHGGFTATTDACAACHRAHSAQFGSDSLLITDPEALCLSCHDGTGAGTNVVMGVYAVAGTTPAGTQGVDGASLFAGGFTNALMATAWSGAATPDSGFDAVSRPTTSHHTLGDPTVTIWGSGANNTANGSMTLECTSCHDPHGNAGWDTTTTPDTRVASYRLLRWQPQGSNGFTAPATNVNWSGGAFPVNDATAPVSGWLVPDAYPTIGTEWYTIGTQTTLSACGKTGTSACGSPFAAGDYNAGNGEIVYRPLNTVTAVTQNYVPAAVAEAYFCAQCHDRYFNNSSLRTATDASAYCGDLVTAPDADGVAPWINPNDPVNCQPVVNASNVLLSWGDNSPSGDTTYMYRHTSGDIRASMDGTVAAGTGTSVKRSCVACHVAHGTASAADSVATDGVNASTASLAGGSVLLRMDGRTICLRCHASSVNFTVAP